MATPTTDARTRSHLQNVSAFAAGISAGRVRPLLPTASARRASSPASTIAAATPTASRMKRHGLFGSANNRPNVPSMRRTKPAP